MSNALLYNGIVLDLMRAIEHNYLTEEQRAKIHALTRKVTLSDEDIYLLFRRALKIIGREYAIEPSEAEILFKDLRDRYEERGKYAPAEKAKP